MLKQKLTDFNFLYLLSFIMIVNTMKINQFLKDFITFLCFWLYDTELFFFVVFIFDYTTPFNLSSYFINPFSISVFSLFLFSLSMKLSISRFSRFFLLFSTVWYPSFKVCYYFLNCFLSFFFRTSYLLAFSMSSW